VPPSNEGPCKQIHHADVLTEEACGDATSESDHVADPLELGRIAACSSGAYSVAPFGAVYLPASPAYYSAKCDFPLTPIPCVADPDSLGLYGDFVLQEPGHEEVCADSNCNVSLWLNDSMC